MNPDGFRWLQVILMLASITGGRAALAEQLEEMPSLEMLEFLADWETTDGKWIDPAILQQENSLLDKAKEPTVDEYDES